MDGTGCTSTTFSAPKASVSSSATAVLSGGLQEEELTLRALHELHGSVISPTFMHTCMYVHTYVLSAGFSTGVVMRKVGFSDSSV